MTLWQRIRAAFASQVPLQPPAPAAPAPAVRQEPRISAHAMALANSRPEAPEGRFGRPQIMPGVIPANMRATVMAMDADLAPVYDFANAAYSGLGFVGYPFLSELAQRPEYRKMSEVLATEMTRKWIRLQSSGDADKSEKIAALERAMKRYRLRATFRKAALHDGLFGRSQVYIDVKTPKGTPARADTDELTSILVASRAKIARGALVGFKVIEPIWTTPFQYNSDDPMRPDFFKPQSWFVMGKQVHATRLLNFVSREVPDMLKPSYNFGGLSLSQMAMPYVENWLRTRQSVSDLISAFSVPVLKTNLGSILQGGMGDDVFHRLALFNKMRNNRGAWAINNGDANGDGEEFDIHNVPLSGLSELQAQSQEHMSSVSGIPLVKLTGITPAGLNANSDGEIRVFYDTILSMQEGLFRPNLERALEIIQLSEFGEIDPEIGFEFVPLYELSEKERADMRKVDADTDAVLIGAGVISPEEARARVAADPGNGYHSLEVDAGRDDEFDDDADDDDGLL